MEKLPVFSVMSYSFHGLHNVGAINLFGYMETVKYRYGLDTADIWNGMVTRYDDNYIKLVKQNLDQRGLRVVNLCCDGAHVWDDDEEVRRNNEETAWKCINLAEKIGAATIRIDYGVRDETAGDDKLEYAAKKYREYCKRAAAFGAKLGTENHWGASRVPSELDKLFDAVGEPNFGLLLHLGNWVGGDPDEMDGKYIRRAMHTHINYEHCVDADRVLPPLYEAGYSGSWSVESHLATNEYNNVAFQLAQVRRVLAPMNYDGAWRNGPPNVKP